MSAIAIVGMACRYPGARSPRELWENVLAQRRSFRRVPQIRLNLADYSAEPGAEDGIYLRTAALLEDYEFDRVRFQVSKEAFASTDLVHWLALDLAAQALEDAKLLHITEAERERVGVYVGNSLTGEFSRANLLRLRWPYVRRVLAASLKQSANGDLHNLLDQIEALYKAPFPATTEESLAGGLSNTIAGRICNYFNFKGGGYTVDGACASSLLAIVTACSALENGDVDVAIAGGVDLSLDPFELAGFSKLGALARDKMRVFDERSSGFFPGEGGGMVVLMRDEHAAAHQLPPYALLRGWGISSDGSGGITRPEVAGQSLALRRAYQRAEYGIDSVAYFEGHGTGTTVGDATELQALSAARHEAGSKAAAGLGSIKANIGHTKAAAGVAGLIKAAMAVRAKVLPPTTGCETPHSELRREKPVLRILREGELWPDSAAVRAGVSAMGFGGINSHVTLESADTLRRKNFTGFEQQLLSSPQDCELFLFQADNSAELALRLQEVLNLAGELSYSEMSDLAAALAKQIGDSTEKNTARATCIATTPDELECGIRELLEWCAAGVEERVAPAKGLFLTAKERTQRPRIGFLFPGQGSPVYLNGGAWSRRFAGIREIYDRAKLPATGGIATEVAQPSVVTASLSGLHALELCGIQAEVALGHSLGEITALYWAGACTQENLLRMVRERGRIMAEMAAPSGSMASVRADSREVKARINGDPLAIAAYNSPRQTVISGDAQAIRKFTANLSAAGIAATTLPVSHAFHSPLVSDVATGFSEYLEHESFAPLRRRVVSTVNGAVLDWETDLRELLTRQITRPVRFSSALEIAAADCDLLLEVGPGAVLAGIAAECTDKPVIALNACGESLRGLLLAVGAAFSMGADVRIRALFENRFVRPFDFKQRHSFLTNPCETIVDSLPAHSRKSSLPAFATSGSSAVKEAPVETTGSALELLRNLVAQRTELPVAGIKPEQRFLDDLHLNSITVSQIVLQAAAQLGVSAPTSPTEYANASLAQAAETLEGIRQSAPARSAEKFPHGVDSWIRALAVEWVEQPVRQAISGTVGSWQVRAAQDSSKRELLEQEFRAVPGSGMVCCIPRERSQDAAVFVLECIQAALQQRAKQVVFLQDGGSAAALARALYLEHPEMKVTVVNVPADFSKAAQWAAREASAALGFTEVRYDADGIRREPRVKLLWPSQEAAHGALGEDDVLLVSGGGKGIAAECGLKLAREYKCRVALVGRSDPERDQELRKNLSRFTDSGVKFGYFAADVADSNSLARATRQIETEFGGITAVLHGAGSNAPKRLEQISADDLQQTFGPKLHGLMNILRSVDADKLRLLITFGSIIARTGLHGEGHYGWANEWLTAIVEEWQENHLQCRCVNLEWSVWAGIGMGQRLGVLESLMRQGITPLPLDEALRTLKTMIGWQQAPVSSIVTGRFGTLPTLQFAEKELPLRRFLEDVQVHYPGIELIADSELSAHTDFYVTEHVFQNEQLLPAVVGMEAMAQAAMALEETERLPELRQLRFEHPIVIPAGKSVKIRVAALRREPGKISVAIRCSSTGFQIDHFSGECAFNVNEPIKPFDHAQPLAAPLALDFSRDLYGGILFHQGRFRRVEKYHLLRADMSIAELAPPAASPWYARHLPAEFAAGDPASRDAALHSIQACIPHKTILPVGVDRIVPSMGWTMGRSTIHAVERLRDGDDFIYDLEIRDEHGQTCERWEGLHLHAVAPTRSSRPLALPLLSPYLERMLNEFMPNSGIQVLLNKEDNSSEALQQLIGREARITRRPDGKPEITGSSESPHISISHCCDLTLILLAKHGAGCDLERVAGQNAEDWKNLLGESLTLARLMAERSRASLETAAAQVWSLKEALRKAGASFDQPPGLQSLSGDWATFSGGGFAAATFHARIEDSDFAFAFVIHKEP
jgi:enediyne polyketide synthase